jgi:dimethylamine--corrinoid protein Co-methyltransferase
MPEHLTRRGDGRLITMTGKQIKDDLELGSKDAAERAKIPELTGEDLETLYEIIIDANKVVAVKHGCEVVLSADAGGSTFWIDSGTSGLGMPIERSIAQGALSERVLGLDILQFPESDGSFKPAKVIVSYLANVIHNTLHTSISPLEFMAMPNLGYFYKPDGQWPEPISLIREGKNDEARKSMEGAARECHDAIIYVAKHLRRVGVDGINIDTVGAAGDPDFYAALTATESLKKVYPDLAVQMGMATEAVHGFHTELKYAGERLAGMWPHQQLKVAEKAGVDIFGPVINTKPHLTFPWNLSRAVTFTKACVREATIPVHPNMGMGVGGVPMLETPPLDTVTRANKAMIEIAGVDGI